MTVFTTSTTTITLDGDGSTNTGTINAPDFIDTVTGGSGIKTVRLVNTSAANVALITYTPQTTSYTFTDVAYTTDSVDGTGASFDVTVNFDGYTVSIVDGGVDFLVDDQILILGEDLGGSTTANNLTLTVTSVSGGAITGVSIAGTVAWPQSIVGQVRLLPNSEEFVLISTENTGSYFTGLCTDGQMIIQPVTIVG